MITILNKKTFTISLILFSTLSLYSQPSIEKNYIKESTYRLENANDVKENIIYYDDLGRAIQTVLHKQSSEGNDLIQPIEYDGFGRKVKNYLFYASAYASQKYNDNALNDVIAYYNKLEFENTTKPYKETILDNSSLSRVIANASEGTIWSKGSGNEVFYDYDTNAKNDSVKIIKAITNFNANFKTYDNQIQNNGLYSGGVLNKNTIKDENWVAGSNNFTTQEFITKDGLKILSRKFNNNKKHDTYYIYDDLGNIVLIIPPIASKADNLTSQIINDYCFQFKYDDRGRMVEKKNPGANWEYFIYDLNNRLILKQNPILEGAEWIFFKYDILDREIYSGIYKSALTRNELQIRVDQAVNLSFSEKRIESSFSNNGINIFYSNDAFPTDNLTILNIKYYDSYSNTGASNFGSYEGQTLIGNGDGQLKESLVAEFINIMGTNKWEKKYHYYDKKYNRLVRIEHFNYLGGMSIVNNKFDFYGRLLKEQITHKKLQNDSPIIIEKNLSYNKFNDKVEKITHKINNEAPELILFNSYNSINQLIVKKNGTKNLQGSTYLQNVSYKYNIRGWLTDVNNINDDNHLFNMKLYYNGLKNVNNVGDINKPLFDGSISYIETKTKNDNKIRGYKYTYDHLYQLTNADFYNGAITSKFSKGEYNERLTYDRNGNILTLFRTGEELPNGNILELDDLQYLYSGNQLKSVKDLTNNSVGFLDGNNTDVDYTYDLMGNVKTDKNKGIQDIKYNHLSLPIEITFTIGKITYLYDSYGTRLQKNVLINGQQPIKTDYINGFQYENDELQFFPHDEGYVKYKGSNQFLYVYQYKDHLGNIRLSYADINGNGTIEPATEILEENNYYPFGLKHKGYNEIANAYRNEAAEKYKFGGKEWNSELGLDLYDFGARNYDPALGRWLNVDPLAEKYPDWTPYHYVHNNPINLIDPTGMSATPPPGGKEGDLWTDQDGSWKFTNGIWEDTSGGGNDMYSDNLSPLEITKDNRSFGAKMADGIMENFRREALAMVPGNSSDAYGMPMGPDAMSIGGSIGASGGIVNFNFILSLAATGNNVALVYGFDYGIGEFTKPGFSAGITLNAHNSFGGSTDILSELGGEDLSYSLGYGVKGSYGVSSRTIGNKTMHAERGAKTYGVGLGYGGGVSKSNTNVYKFSNLRKDMSQGVSRIQNTVLQAITQPKMF